jgi:hypothetical protein
MEWELEVEDWRLKVWRWAVLTAAAPVVGEKAPRDGLPLRLERAAPAVLIGVGPLRGIWPPVLLECAADQGGCGALVPRPEGSGWPKDGCCWAEEGEVLIYRTSGPRHIGDARWSGR